MKEITIGYSPCPNDTFIFYGLVHGKVETGGLTFVERLADVETLNKTAFDGSLDVSKVSYHTVGLLRETYALLRSGGALGRGCGPLVVARQGARLEDLKRARLAIPGRFTTAFLLLRLYDPALDNIHVMTYDRIMKAVAKGDADAGLIIHESRFTYPAYGLEKLIDLGEWWEERTGLPIPLGGIVGKRSLGRDVLQTTEASIRESIRYALSHRDEVLSYCGRYAQEMDPYIMRRHISLYVNDFSLDLGDEGLKAVRRLFEEAESSNILSPTRKPLLAAEIQ